MQEQDFTTPTQDDTIFPNLLIEEEEELLPKYHHENSIYLYVTLENKTANEIVHTGVYQLPLTLYETPEISRTMAINILKPVTLRIAVNLAAMDNDYVYDQLTMIDAKIKERYKLGIEDYKKKCSYTRCLVQEPKSRIKIIEYKIQDANRLYINPQYI